MYEEVIFSSEGGDDPLIGSMKERPEIPVQVTNYMSTRRFSDPSESGNIYRLRRHGPERPKTQCWSCI